MQTQTDNTASGINERSTPTSACSGASSEHAAAGSDHGEDVRDDPRFDSGTTPGRRHRSAIGVDPVAELLAASGVETKDAMVREGKDKRTILIINTGGTLGMRKNGDGRLAPAPGYFTSQMLRMHDLCNSDDMPGFDIVEYEPLLDSSCFQPSDWVRIANDIRRAYYSYDGFVVCMGTDTMAYTASAMSFMLENLGKTVIFTGSQIPFAEVYNDARRNVAVAMILASNQDIPEVCIFFSDRLLRANRSVKVDSLALGAFESPNFPPLGRLGVTMRYRRDLVLPQPRGPFRVHTEMDSKVVVYKLIPGFDDEALLIVSSYATKLRAVVLELYGTGNSPIRKQEFVRFLEVANERGILVVAVTQCRQGAVDLTAYAVGAALQDSGVISGVDMTTEAVVTKLAYLFGRTDDPKVVKRMMERNLRGEMSPNGGFANSIFAGPGKMEIEKGDYVERVSYQVGPLPRL